MNYFIVMLLLVCSVFNHAETVLYVYRPLLNEDDVRHWAKEQGLEIVSNMHVTLAFSRNGIQNWSVVKDVKPCNIYNTDPNKLRQFDLFGRSGTILVLKLNSPELTQRWEELIAAEATWDYPTYEPHITLSYSGYNYDIKQIIPYDGELIFGPEVYEFR